ncbi:MAG: tRNA lysidine(34) synthetase TilS, partial [Firmicutes bacterium]|nr:tRNA lysidine(34) synthetase TilS [Bacillota bacterium]
MITKGEEVRTILRQISERGYPKGVLIVDAGALSEASGIPEEELAGNICTRTRHEGDFLPARAGTKKLKKLFGEMKIPADERDRTPLIAAGKCVLAVCPGNGENTRYADALSVNNETKVILTVKFV